MSTDSRISRRLFLNQSGTVSLGLASIAEWGMPPSRARAADAPADVADLVRRIVDPEIRAGVEAAVFRNLMGWVVLANRGLFLP